MPWPALPMQYATIMPQHAINRLLTIDLDGNFSMNASKMWCKCLLTKMQVPFDKDANAIFYLWCKCPMQGWKCKVYSWWYQCMHSNHDVNVSLQRWRCQCLLMGMSWYKCLIVRMPWCKCFDANTIYSKISFVFKSRLFQRLKPKYFSFSFFFGFLT